MLFRIKNTTLIAHFLLFTFLFVIHKTEAQEQVVVSMRTSLPNNSNFSLFLRCANNSIPLKIDYGNGILEPVFLSDSLLWYDFSGKTKGENIRIYTDVNNITGIKTVGNQLSDLNISANKTLKEVVCHDNQLKTLNCSGIDSLKVLLCHFNLIEELNVSGCTVLDTLGCYFNQLKRLDVSTNKNLKALWCSNNLLDRLDLSENNQLISLITSYNRLSFSSFILPENKLKKGWKKITLNRQQVQLLSNCYDVGEEIDLSYYATVNQTPSSFFWRSDEGVLKKEVDYLIDKGKTVFLRSFDYPIYCIIKNDYFSDDYSVSRSFSLLTTAIWVGREPAPSIPTTDEIAPTDFSLKNPQPVIRMHSSLESGEIVNLILQPAKPYIPILIDYGDGVLVKQVLSNIDTQSVLSKKIQGKEVIVYADTNDIAGIDCTRNKLSYFDVSSCKKLRKLNCLDNNLSELILSENRSLEELNCSQNQLKALDLKNNQKLKYLSLDKNSLSRLDLQYVPELKQVECSDNQLTELNIDENKSLTSLRCNNNQLNRLNLSQHQSMGVLECNNNQLQELSLNESADYRQIHCNNNQLKELKISSYKELFRLSCANNHLSELDVFKNTELEILRCQHNRIAVLDISQSNPLNSLDCSHNQLVSLLLPEKLTAKSIKCNDNLLGSLNITENTTLSELECQNNQLTSLNIVHSPVLSYLNCSNNRLTALNIHRNKYLEKLYCANNDLTDLDISNSSELTQLDCSGNQLKKLNASSNPYLHDLNITENTCLSESSVKLPWNKLFGDDDSNSIIWGNKRKFSPEIGAAFNVGYYTIPFKAAHTVHIGGEIGFSPYRKYPYGGGSTHQFFLGGGIYHGKFDGKTETIPAFSLCYSTGSATFLDFKVIASKYHINPNIGLNLINLAKLHLGYSIATDNKISGMKMQGFTMSISISLGTRGYYPDLSN